MLYWCPQIHPLMQREDKEDNIVTQTISSSDYYAQANATAAWESRSYFPQAIRVLNRSTSRAEFLLSPFRGHTLTHPAAPLRTWTVLTYHWFQQIHSIIRIRTFVYILCIAYMQAHLILQCTFCIKTEYSLCIDTYSPYDGRMKYTYCKCNIWLLNGLWRLEVFSVYWHLLNGVSLLISLRSVGKAAHRGESQLMKLKRLHPLPHQLAGSDV